MRLPTLLSVLLTSLFFVSCVTEDDEVIERVKVGDRVPVFAVDLSDGTHYDSRTAGASVIIFFHTDCADCQRELPLINARYARGEYADRRVVCISRAEGEAPVAAFWQSHGLTLPYSAQPDRRIFDLFASAGIPRIYETDATGTIIRVTLAE